MKRFISMTLLAVAVMLSACVSGISPIDLTATAQAGGSTGSDSGAGQGSSTDSQSALEGDVVVDGSSTVFPLTTAVAEEFATTYPDVRVSVGLSGTGGGFSKFCSGETDISDASRPIKQEEADICATNGIEYAEFQVATDGLTVVANPANDWLQCLTVDQLAQVFGVNSTITQWSDIDPTWPAEDILFFVPDPDSGTRDYMIEVIEKADENATDIRQDNNTTNSSDDNVLLDGVANEEYAIGFFGFAYYTENADELRDVAIQNSDGDCVQPSNETVQGGTYNPLSRPLFIYPNLASLTEKPQVAEFVKFYLDGGAANVMSSVGYSEPPAGTYEDDLAKLLDLLP